MRTAPTIAALFVTLIAVDAQAMRIFEDEKTGTHFDFTGYAQPYYRWVQNPCVVPRDGGPCEESTVPDGFGLTRARIGFEGRHADRTDFKAELRTIPNVELLALRLRFELFEGVKLTVGRFKVPFSRQELTSESRLQLIDRAAFIKATPGRQLGASLSWETGFFTSALPKDFFRLDVGLFNGESAKERAPVNNIDEDFLYAVRAQVAPFGAPRTFAEGDVRPAVERVSPVLAVGANWTYEKRGEDNGNYKQQNIAADILFAWYGASFYGEYFRYDRDYVADISDPDRHGAGWNVQLGYFIPAPYLKEHLEIAGRVEAWDPAVARKDDRADELLSEVSGSGPARPGSTQAHRDYVAGINWYFDGHDLKLQINYTRRTEIEEWQRSKGNDEVPRDVDDDSVFAQLTYRF